MGLWEASGGERRPPFGLVMPKAGTAGDGDGEGLSVAVGRLARASNTTDSVDGAGGSRAQKKVLPSLRACACPVEGCDAFWFRVLQLRRQTLPKDYLLVTAFETAAHIIL
jgi:hypothetical protein